MVARLVRDQKVAGSNPVTSTKIQPEKAGFFMHSAQKERIIPDFSVTHEKRTAKDFVGYCRILTHFSVTDRRQMQLAEISRNPRSPAATGGGFQTWAERIRLSGNVAFWQSADEPDIDRHAKADMGGNKWAQQEIEKSTKGSK